MSTTISPSFTLSSLSYSLPAIISKSSSSATILSFPSCVKFLSSLLFFILLSTKDFNSGMTSNLKLIYVNKSFDSLILLT